VKKCLLIALGFAITPTLFAQIDAAKAPSPDPEALIQMAAPLYDYASPDMKPWHIRYHYQAFDENGQATGDGTFDYWWSTSNVTRATWTQGDQSRTEWHTAEGKELDLMSGTGIGSVTHRLYGVLHPGFLAMKDPQTDDRQLKYFTTKTSTTELACVGSVHTAGADRPIPSLGSVWPGYCFLEQQPVLVASHENGTLMNVYGKVQKFQNHYFPGDVEILYVGKKRVQATLEDLKEVAADNDAFTPTADAKEPVPQKFTVTRGQEIKVAVPIQRIEPVYPASARGAGVGGKVVIEAIIGKDGKIKDAKIVTSPDSSLSAAALDAVRQWRYEPSAIGGQTSDMNTTITFNFVPHSQN
jgi:TonB family protein